ncbi:MAG: response regulator transcription factor [Anaerolineae bacterium]|jgi:NarL family two-component system response regulator LiaR
MSETEPIRVIIVDDHAMLRRGLKFFLKGFDDLELVGEANSGPAALDLCAEVQPDVVIMDMVMPGMDGAQATQEIRSRYPDVQVIALTSFQEEDLIERALQAGAIGYLLKNVDADGLARAIREAHAGRSTLAPEATEMLIQATRQRAPQPDYGLTQREKEVLALLVEGLSNAEISERLVITVATVKFHVRGILSKLGVSSRTEAIALAWQEKLVS